MDKGMKSAHKKNYKHAHEFACRLHMGPHAQKKHGVEAKHNCFNAAKAPTVSIAQKCIDRHPEGMKVSMDKIDRKSMCLSCNIDNTGIDTGNNAESQNHANLSNRAKSIVVLLRPLAEREEKRFKAIKNEALSNNSILPKGLTSSKYFKDRKSMGEKLANRVEFREPKELLQGVVKGATGSWNVDLLNFRCSCSVFGCHHLHATALAAGKSIDDHYPADWKADSHKEQVTSAGDFPPVPAKAEVDELVHLHDEKIMLPAVVKKKKGAPKKNVRKKSAIEMTKCGRDRAKRIKVVDV